MEKRLLTVRIAQETDIILVRQRTRQIAQLVGFDNQEQTRITTAVSEIVRNTIEYANGGYIAYALKGERKPEYIEIVVRDEGPGVKHLDDILAGRHRSSTGMGVGILGARRLMDDFHIQSTPGAGTVVTMSRALSAKGRALLAADIGDIGRVLAAEAKPDALSEIRTQNQELVIQLDELQKRQEQLGQLNQELQDTNRGVVALYAELEERADHLRRADELKSRFLSNMSHEFRTPLNSIMSLSRLLLTRTDGELTAEQDQQIQFIRKSAETLRELVDDLLDIAKVEAGKTVATPKKFTVADLFSALRGMLRPLLVSDTVILTFDEADDVPDMLTDEAKVSQILRNFISNALKFTERGEVRAWAQANSDGSVTFYVRDTGIGIAEEHLNLIWDEFSQVPHQLQSRFKGTGLGLPLSKRLAELLGGSVAVQSAPGQGSLFSVTLPAVLPTAADKTSPIETWRLDPDRIPILVVEDNPADAFSYTRALAHSRYQALEARTVDQARRALELIRPAAILLDVLLAAEESWHFLIQIRQREATSSIPVIVVSTTHEETKARQLGADDYLPKPIDPAQLVFALDKVTGAHSITRVLLVDDEEISRYLVRQLLPRGTFVLTEATNAHEGIERLNAETPDVILLDLRMPQGDGFEFMEKARAPGGKPLPPTLVLSSTSIDDGMKERLHGVAGFVSKNDLTVDSLLGAIRKATATEAAAH